MSDNPYLDTYIGRIYNEDGECVELQTIRATDFDHARSKAEVPDGMTLDVKRWRASTLVASPSDKERARRRKTRAPQYGKGERNHA